MTKSPGSLCRGLFKTILNCALTTLLLASSAFAAPIEGPFTFPAFTPASSTSSSNAETSGAQYNALANGTTTDKPSIEAIYAGDTKIVVDGQLDEDIWEMAQLGDGIRQADPIRYSDASVPTTFKIAYDDDAIYFAVACYEHDMANVSSSLSRRDQLENSDIVSIYIDPYHDLTTGYNFRVNADGVLQDDYIFANGNRDRDWNAVWEAETWSDDRGWYVEVRVPFSAIKFKPAENMTWGLQVYRWLHGRGEDTAWVLWDQRTSGFVNRFGTLTGLRGVSNPRQLEAVPYMAIGITDRSDPNDDVESWDSRVNVGADFKYGITSDLTLNATIQPDFGQVEADPASLNLSPYETYFSEKRGFFIEGSRFFSHPNANMFYSRRIGTGHVNSRIRGAAKLTGKLGGSLSIAALAAATDVAPEGKSHNPFAGGDHKAYYGIVRIGKEFSGGDHFINLMQTVVKRDENPTLADFNSRNHRDAYSTGIDFQMNFLDRKYRIQGGAVGTVLDYKAPSDAPEQENSSLYGTGGAINFNKMAGTWQYGLNGRWETEKFNPNDMGFDTSNDMTRVMPWVEYRFNSSNEDGWFNNFNFNVTGQKTWLYAGKEAHADSGDLMWSYEGGHNRSSLIETFVWCQTKGYWSVSGGFSHAADGTSKYTTRGGPLMTEPSRTTMEIEIDSDWRKTFAWDFEFEHSRNRVGDRTYGYSVGLRWNQNGHISHRLNLGYEKAKTDAGWIGKQDTAGSGFDDISYVFAQRDQQVWDLTLRSSVLFNRNNSLELYMQPFFASANYTRPRHLATADSYDLQFFDLDASQEDFKKFAVNMNLVYRWEYSPGSTIFVVWTHSRNGKHAREDIMGTEQFNNDFDAGYMFRNEPRNVFMLKFSYWLPI